MIYEKEAITIEVFVSSKKVSTQGADMDSLGHQCANPMQTGALDRMGKGDVFLPQNQCILLDAVIRASEKMGWNYNIVNVSDFSWWKKYRSKEPVPRIEYDGHILEGTPMSNDIIQFVLQYTSED